MGPATANMQQNPFVCEVYIKLLYKSQKEKKTQLIEVYFSQFQGQANISGHFDTSQIHSIKAGAVTGHHQDFILVKGSENQQFPLRIRIREAYNTVVTRFTVAKCKVNLCHFPDFQGSFFFNKNKMNLRLSNGKLGKHFPIHARACGTSHE